MTFINTQYTDIPAPSQKSGIHDPTIDKVTKHALALFQLNRDETWELPHKYVMITKTLRPKYDKAYCHLAQIEGTKSDNFIRLFKSDESMPFEYPKNGDFSIKQKQYLAQLYWDKYIQYEDSSTYNPQYDAMYTWITGDTPPATNPVKHDLIHLLSMELKARL